ncbi:YIP1 family protein [Streptomyces cellulosae]
MSQLGSNARPRGRGPAHGRPGPGTFSYVAGFRIGRGRNNDGAPQGRPPHPPHGRQTPPAPSYGYPPAPQPPSYGQGAGGGSPWPQPHAGRGAPGGYGGQGGHGEPEYFGGGGYPTGPQGAPHDPYAANNPGHTQAFSIDDQYHQDDVHQPPAGPVGPRLHWKALLKGIVLSPQQTFLQMRDYTMWGPALVVTFLYGLLAVFGFDGAREDAINATLSNAIPIVLTTAVALVISAFVLGVVTHTLARQLGGNGAWQPTVGLSMLIMSISDAPRLVFAMFAGGDATFVQLLGWATWVAGGALLTLMVSRSHDLPWPKALGASSIQLIALLSIVKLGTF